MEQIFNLINEMSPYLLLGFCIAGLMHTFVPNRLYSRYLSGNNLRSVLYAAALGVPLPLCSCGVLPTAMSLRREGASKGATTSFLIATPQTGIDSIMATYSLMGLPFAIIRPIAALVTALLGGALVNAFDKEKDINEIKDTTFEHKSLTLHEKLLGALRYGYVEMMQDIGRWLIIGLLVAGFITIAVPDGFFASFVNHPLLGMLLALACAVPMYLCATGSIPIAVALMLKGMTPGAALVLLMAGPAVNVASVLVISKVLGKRTLWLYLTAIIGGALIFALGIDYLMPHQWFTQSLTTISDPCHPHTPWFNIASTALLSVLLIHAMIRRYIKHYTSCNCGDNNCPNTTTKDHANASCGCHDCGGDGHNCPSNANVSRTFIVSGMHCNHCRNSVLRAIGNLADVESVEVDLASGLMQVTGQADTAEIIKALDTLGFKAQSNE